MAFGRNKIISFANHLVRNKMGTKVEISVKKQDVQNENYKMRFRSVQNVDKIKYFKVILTCSKVLI